MLYRDIPPNLDCIQVFNVSVGNAVDYLAHRSPVPRVGRQCLLKDLVEQCAVDEWSRRIIRRLNPILENSSAHARKRVGHHRCGYQLVRVDDNDVLGVVDHAAAIRRELSDNVDKDIGLGGSVDPSSSQMDASQGLGVVRLDK